MNGGRVYRVPDPRGRLDYPAHHHALNDHVEFEQPQLPADASATQYHEQNQQQQQHYYAHGPTDGVTTTIIGTAFSNGIDVQWIVNMIMLAAALILIGIVLVAFLRYISSSSSRGTRAKPAAVPAYLRNAMHG